MMRRNVYNPTCALIVAATLVLPIGAAFGQQSSPSAQPAADAPRDPDGAGADHRPVADSDARARFRDWLRERIERQTKELERMQQLHKALEDGKSYEEIRATMPEIIRPRSGGGRDFTEWLRGRFDQDRGNDRGERPSPPDVDRLGPSPMPRDTGAMGRGEHRGGPHSPDKAGQAEPARDLTDDERAAVNEFFKATAPALYDKMVELKKQDPAEAERRLQEAMPRIRYILSMRARDPDMYDLRLTDIKFGRASLEAARAVAQSEASGNEGSRDHEAKVQKLQHALEEQYDHRTRILRREVEKSKDKASALAADIDKRPARRAEIVGKNIREMIERERKRVQNGSESDRKPELAPPPGQ